MFLTIAPLALVNGPSVLPDVDARAFLDTVLECPFVGIVVFESDDALAVFEIILPGSGIDAIIACNFESY
jgi:hypothetical protein